MKVLLVGHEGSKCILPASSWLVNKYLPKEFEVSWLNYGEYKGELLCGEYVQLDVEQIGGARAWAGYIKGELETMDDDYVIFALDDFLLSEPLNMEMYNLLLENMGGDVVCGKLSDSSFYKIKEIEGNLVRVGKDAYTVTAQYTIWKRWALIEILQQVNNPWHFEETGTNIFNGRGFKLIGTDPYALGYPDYSALSNRWPGIKTIDNNKLDIKELKKHGYL